MTIAKDQFFVDFQRLTMFRGSPEEMKSFTTPNSEWEPTGNVSATNMGKWEMEKCPITELAGI